MFQNDKQLLVILVLTIYLLFLAGVAWITAKKSSNNREYLFGTGFGSVLSLFGISASLFSSFTLQGMPEFFKNHGIGAWVFLGITDVCLATLLLYFGLKMRKFSRLLAHKNQGFATNNLTEWLKQSQMPKWVILFFVVASTIFMIPYITIGIKGSAVLLQNAVPLGENYFIWSVIIVLMMLGYSWLGGIRAVFITDVVQGVILMFAIWAVAVFAIQGANGITALFSDIQQIEPKLLSAPGPVGLINWQFLLVSFISIVTIPYVQPQMTTRIFVAKNDRAFTRSTMGLAVFALLVILPTLFVGLRAVQLQHEMGNITGDFLLNLISHDAPAIFFAIFIVGVLASNMSTTDSQLLAIGTEWRSAMLTEDIQANATAKSGVKTVGLIVAILALLLAQTSFQSLILFAINSFIATSLLLPIVVAATYQSSKIRLVLSIISVVTVCIFSLSMFNIVPKMIVGYRIELFLYAITGFCLLLTFIKEKK